MRLCTAVAFVAVPFLPVLSAHSEPVISGFVTSAGTLQYQVNAVTILCNPSTTTERVEQKVQTGGDHRCPMRYIGESVSVFGQKDKQSGIFRATSVERDKVGDLALQGSALVDKVLVPPTMTSGTLRADGLPLTIVLTTNQLRSEQQPDHVRHFYERVGPLHRHTAPKRHGHGRVPYLHA